MSFESASLPDGWRVWNEEAEGRTVLVYRPDVFDGDRFPAACLPTLYVTNGSPRRRPGAAQREADEWRVTLFLEPDVEAESSRHDEREEAVAAARDLTDRFASGEIDYRGAYQVPREEYFAELDELTGRKA
ncbi:hypothetical protein HUG10_04410 [Halorarum halophilum]|uniref:Uncharacterized protein n=1 Tax=Halorarum halophilum TaxID=2743090 RepID=A0A7D5GDR3_9EURY|nr:DUF5820 family protein [Halobaculum halophilum]QLG26828.1 hypothetical protein HUG10_04410 [Halobaculum halophilum]